MVAPTPTLSLVVERVAEAAAGWRVQADAADPDNATLLTVGLDARPGDLAFQTQLDRLFLRVLASQPAFGSPLRLQAEALWTEAFALSGSPETAWTLVLAWMLRHPDFLVY